MQALLIMIAYMFELKPKSVILEHYEGDVHLFIPSLQKILSS